MLQVEAVADEVLLLEHAQAMTEVTRLERLERSHERAQGVLQIRVRDNEEQLAVLERRVASIAAVIARDPHRTDPKAPFGLER